MLNPWIVGIGSSFLGALAFLTIGYLLRRILELRGEYSRLWEDRIFDDSNEIVKRDYFYLRQNRESVSGVILRFFPDDQSHRRWDLRGKISGNEFIGIFWTINKSFTSRGCFYL